MKRLVRTDILLLLALLVLAAVRLAIPAWRFAHAPREFSFLWASGFLVCALALLVRKLRASRSPRPRRSSLSCRAAAVPPAALPPKSLALGRSAGHPSPPPPGTP